MPLLRLTTFVFLLLSATAVFSQTQEKLVFVEELKPEAREQLRRIVAYYDLDDWIFTNETKAVHGEDAHSYPKMRMTTVKAKWLPITASAHAQRQSAVVWHQTPAGGKARRGALPNLPD